MLSWNQSQLRRGEYGRIEDEEADHSFWQEFEKDFPLYKWRRICVGWWRCMIKKLLNDAEHLFDTIYKQWTHTILDTIFFSFLIIQSFFQFWYNNLFQIDMMSNSKHMHYHQQLYIWLNIIYLSNDINVCIFIVTCLIMY